MPTFVSKLAFYAILIAVLLACAGLGVWRAALIIDGWIGNAATTATVARDAHWQGEIAKANANAARNIIEQMRAARAADLATQATIDRLKDQISELEAKNEGLPDRDGSGIDRARTRLLNNEPLAEIRANDPH
ncbi:hypothetical protein CQ054_05945 [Ochrobactrum sp. MYb29]|nr:hypothetical protein CQ054_05945 [Ochrobactrum sp. MYb29]